MSIIYNTLSSSVGSSHPVSSSASSDLSSVSLQLSGLQCRPHSRSPLDLSWPIPDTHLFPPWHTTTSHAPTVLPSDRFYWQTNICAFPILHFSWPRHTSIPWQPEKSWDGWRRRPGWEHLHLCNNFEWCFWIFPVQQYPTVAIWCNFPWH